jgi:4-amino-4-deoxy-L-arabinose transferase-like glycosyltransferase
LSNSKRIHYLSLLSLALVCYLSFFRGLDDYGLWDPDEGRVGVIAKGMVESGNWVTPTRHGSPYYDKPAFFFWLVALGVKAFGASELPVRLPSAVAATLLVGLVYAWGAALHGWRVGLWSGLVLATSLEFTVLGRFGNADMVFTFFFAAALFSFFWARTDKPRAIWLFYATMGLACLVKGPAGIVLPVTIVVLRALLTREPLGLGRLRLVAGTGLALSVVLPWYVWAAYRDPEYIRTFLWDHNLRRFFVSQPGLYHPEPFHYLLGFLLVGFLPWTFYLPALARYLWERRNERAERLFFVTWALTVLVFFSLSRNKLGTYILPLFPPLAVLVGDLLASTPQRSVGASWLGRWISGSTAAWLVALVALFAAGRLVGMELYPRYFSAGPPIFPSAFFLAGFFLVWRLGRIEWKPGLAALSSLWLIFWFYDAKMGEVSTQRGTRDLARVAARSSPEKVRTVTIHSDSFSFYFPGRVEMAPHIQAIEKMLGDPSPTLAVVKEKHVREMESRRVVEWFVWRVIPYGSALVANFPQPVEMATRQENRYTQSGER